MFEAIQNTGPKVQGNESIPTNVVPLRPSPEIAPPNGSRDVTQEATQEKKPDAEPEVSQAMLEELEQDIEAMHNIGLQFAVHEKSGKTMIKVMDKESSDIIREIPPKTILDLAAKMDEMLGILFDKKV